MATRRGGEAASDVAVRIGRELTGHDLTDLDHFLTARWALSRSGRAHDATMAKSRAPSARCERRRSRAGEALLLNGYAVRDANHGDRQAKATWSDQGPKVLVASLS